MVSLNEFIDPDLSSSDVLHSSGYVSSDGTGGGAGGLSLQKRRELAHKNDRLVGTYHHSQLGRRYGAVKARTADQKSARAYDASTDTFKGDAKYGNRQSSKIKDAGSIDRSIAKRQHFVEPPTRKYNPYG